MLFEWNFHIWVDDHEPFICMNDCPELFECVVADYTVKRFKSRKDKKFLLTVRSKKIYEGMVSNLDLAIYGSCQEWSFIWDGFPNVMSLDIIFI